MTNSIIRPVRGRLGLGLQTNECPTIADIVIQFLQLHCIPNLSAHMTLFFPQYRLRVSEYRSHKISLLYT